MLLSHFITKYILHNLIINILNLNKLSVWNNIHVFAFCSRVQFIDLRFEFHDSSWSFHKSIFSRKHTFHKLFRANRTQDYGLNTSKQVQNYSTLLEFWNHSYGWFPSSSNSLSSKGDVSFWKIIIVCETKYLNKIATFCKMFSKIIFDAK